MKKRYLQNERWFEFKQTNLNDCSEQYIRIKTNTSPFELINNQGILKIDLSTVK